MTLSEKIEAFAALLREREDASDAVLMVRLDEEATLDDCQPLNHRLHLLNQKAKLAAEELGRLTRDDDSIRETITQLIIKGGRV